MPPQPPNEEMIVRILPDGRIVIDGRGLPPRRIRELQETLQEVLGPAQIFDDTRREFPDAERIWGQAAQDEEDAREDERQEGRQGGS